MNRALMERWLSFKKRFKACLEEQSNSHQASDNLTACNQNSRITFTSKPLSFWKKWLQNISLKKI
ncbi:hypothetical protein KVM14_06515 [Helicobacter pylori]|nr:hypothetical protein KVM14_06515 [Helicobacter pylori]